MTIETSEHFIIITADEGKLFRNEITGDILTEQLYLGCNDNADNYEEITLEEAEIIETSTIEVEGTIIDDETNETSESYGYTIEEVETHETEQNGI